MTPKELAYRLATAFGDSPPIYLHLWEKASGAEREKVGEDNANP